MIEPVSFMVGLLFAVIFMVGVFIFWIAEGLDENGEDHEQHHQPWHMRDRDDQES